MRKTKTSNYPQKELDLPSHTVAYYHYDERLLCIVFGVCDQVKLKPACSALVPIPARVSKFEFSKYRYRYYYTI